MSGDDRSTLNVVARHLAAAVEPLDRGFRDADSFRRLMWQLGWDVQGLPPSYVAVADAAVQAAAAAGALADDAGQDEIVALIEAAGDVYTAVDGLGDVPPGVDPAAMPELARNLFEYLLAEHLLAEVPKFFSLLELLGVVRFESVEPADVRPGFVRTRFDWERLPEVLADPASVPAGVLGWGTAEFDFRRAAELLGELTLALGLPSSVGAVPSAYAQAIQDLATGTPARPLRHGLTMPFFDIPVAGAYTDVGLAVTELPAEGAALPGIVIGPMVPDGIAQNIDLGGHWTFKLRAGTDLAEQLGIVLRPGETSVRYPFAPGHSLPSAGLGFSLTYAPDAPAMLFGQPGGNRIELAGATLSIGVDVRGGGVEVTLGTEPRGAALVLSAGSLDGFLGSVLGDGDTRLELPLGLSWSNRTGLDFQAGAGFELSLYPHAGFGVLRFDRVDLAVRGATGAGVTPEIDVRAAAALSGALGPVAYTADRIGLHLPARFEPGNAGPFDIGFGVLWPTGLGLVVDAGGVVTGGGFIRLDPDAGRYTGILELEIFDIGVTAVGVLDTKDARGDDLPAPGFSLLIALSGEFPPIQLGYGFTLNGIGGLAAVNRRLDSDAFLSGVRTGAVDSILFPQDPVAHAHTLVSNLTTVFPVAMGRYVFGPMAILGWGTPALVRAEIGVLLEVPDPARLALVGQASVVLPEDAPVVSLHVDVAALLDAAKRLLAVDASLRDSYVAAFPVSGDMALRFSWADPPNVALAVGGLNPQVTPPPGFPDLRRTTIALGTGDNPRVSLEAYFALTSNSRQFGARAELFAKAGGFSVKGWLGFDALLVVVPLSFRVDFDAGMGLFRGSNRIAGISVDGHLTGPAPFHAWGKGCLSLLFFDICVPFDQTFGERHENTLPPSDPWPLLEAAIRRTDNWSPGLEPDVAAAVALRAPPDAPGTPLLHPMGSATLRQTVLPFNRPLERFGQYEIQGPDRFDIDDVSVGSSLAAHWSLVRDHFPPGDFEDLSETEQLSRPSFEEMDAGVTVGGDFVDGPLVALKSARLEYETRIIDAPWDDRPLARAPLERAVQLTAVARGSRAVSAWEGTGVGKFTPAVPAGRGVVLAAEEYGVASLDTLSVRSDLGTGLTKGAAYGARKRTGDRAGVQVVPVHELVGAS
ncbi:DUF6603 domain-containing protein [Streptomyces sp. NPDC005820]|uniref:DUF6603 domain-containing protein n=1 Tax=Streptomyces sp. NPDC005820 TaxID=3157069 RepID=UPI0033CD07C8